MNSGLILTLLNDRSDGIIHNPGDFGGHMSGGMKSVVVRMKCDVSFSLGPR